MYSVIVNPVSGNGCALRNLPQIEHVLHKHGIKYKIEQTRSREDGSKFAEDAAAKHAEGIIAVGGDGTLFDIVNGLRDSGTPLIFVPCGTGNDFVKSLPLPKNPIEALTAQLNAKLKKIDLCRMNDRYFLNVAGTGFDVEVLRLADRYKDKYHGLLVYLRGLLDALKNYKTFHARVEIDGDVRERSFAILSIGNGCYFGGGMKAVPEADLSDGLLDVVIVKPIRKFFVLPLLTLFIIGKHVKLGIGKLYRCKKIVIENPGMTVNMDGELFDVGRAAFEIIPGGLNVRLP